MNGHSMYPAICDGDPIEVNYFLSPKKTEEIAPGQVVLTRIGAEWVVHRMVRKNRKSVTKGDWSGVFDDTQWVWGEVKRINHKPSRLISDPILATASRFVDQNNNRWVRKGVRFFILTYVAWIRWTERSWKK